MTKAIILDFLQRHKSELSERFGVERIGLFGSYARGEEHERSDIDVAITVRKKDFFVRDEIREFLEKAFGVPVDVGYLDSFRNYYKSKVEKDIVYV